jgi:serine/threonine-protein kinase Chk2
LSDDVTNEAEEGVWGYLIPLDQQYGKPLVLRKRNICPLPDGTEEDSKDNDKDEDGNANDQETKSKGGSSGGYLIGRHPECGKSSDIFYHD